MWFIKKRVPQNKWGYSFNLKTLLSLSCIIIISCGKDTETSISHPFPEYVPNYEEMRTVRPNDTLGINIPVGLGSIFAKFKDDAKDLSISSDGDKFEFLFGNIRSIEEFNADFFLFLMTCSLPLCYLIKKAKCNIFLGNKEEGLPI